jgi:hypothetical protein
VGIVFVVYGSLYLISPEMTTASFRSQASKSSWETVWALLDGNYQTGNLGPLEERFDPAMALHARGNPALIPTWITLILFIILGIWLLSRVNLNGKRGVVAFTGLTFCIVYLWSPGWSPQWVLFLVPLILLCLPRREAVLMAFSIVFINLLEWPALLSRGYNWGLLMTIPLRTFLLVLLAVEMWRVAHNSDRVSLTTEESWKIVERH